MAKRPTRYVHLNARAHDESIYFSVNRSHITNEPVSDTHHVTFATPEGDVTLYGTLAQLATIGEAVAAYATLAKPAFGISLTDLSIPKS